MDYSSKDSRTNSFERRLNFAARWAVESDEEASTETDNIQPNPKSILYEPCSYKGDQISLPMELLALDPEDIKSTIFNMDVWENLTAAEKEGLSKFLPSGPKVADNNQVISKLFAGENIKFGNPVDKFVDDLLAGEFNSEVQRFKTHIDELERKRQLLSMKMYHNRMIKSVLEYKRKAGLKIDDNLIDFFRTIPEDADREEKRQIERAKKALQKQARRHKNDKQFGSILAAATSVALKEELEPPKISTNSTSTHNSKLTSVLLDLGMRLPKTVQVGLPFDDDDIFYSDFEDDKSSATASIPSDNEADLDSLIDDLEADGEAKRSRKRKRDEMETDTLNANSMTDSAATTAKDNERKKVKREKKKILPPLPAEEVFSLFTTIRNHLQTLSSTGASFASICECIKASKKLSSQVPHGFSLEQMLKLALNVLQRPPSDFGFFLQQAKEKSLDSENPSSTVGMTFAPVLPFIQTVEPEANGTEPLFKWVLDASHPQSDKLEILETIFFFSITRKQLTSDMSNVDFQLSRQLRAPQTLESTPASITAEFRSQEKRRFEQPDVPFVYTFAQPLPGFSPQCIATPVKAGVARLHACLKAERPPGASLLALVRDALCRLPGGVGTRPDVVMLLADSQFLLEGLDPAQLNAAVSGALDRLHSEYDSCVRYDNDLRLWINLHRQRSEADFTKMRDLEEQFRQGDVSALALAYELPEQTQSTAAALKGFLVKSP